MILSLRSFKYFYPRISVCGLWCSVGTDDVDVDAEKFDPGMLPPDVLESIEADSFWCLSALLDGIQVPHPSPIKHNTDDLGSLYFRTTGDSKDGRHVTGINHSN